MDVNKLTVCFALSSIQADSVTLDLGYVMNRGFSLRQGLHLPSHDKFIISAEVELSDNVDAIQDEEYDVYFAVKFGEVIVVGTNIMSA